MIFNRIRFWFAIPPSCCNFVFTNKIAMSWVRYTVRSRYPKLPRYGPFTRIKLLFKGSTAKENFLNKRPTASELLTSYLQQRQCPEWTSFFVRYDSLINDHFGLSNFNWLVEEHNVNYHILRTGCWPYVKYHCSRKNAHNLSFENTFFKLIKFFNFGK